MVSTCCRLLLLKWEAVVLLVFCCEDWEICSWCLTAVLCRSKKKKGNAYNFGIFLWSPPKEASGHRPNEERGPSETRAVKNERHVDTGKEVGVVRQADDTVLPSSLGSTRTDTPNHPKKTERTARRWRRWTRNALSEMRRAAEDMTITIIIASSGF